MTPEQTVTEGLNTAQLNKLMLIALEHEMGGVRVYETALQCALNEDLRAEWSKYLGQTRRHVEILGQACRTLGINPNLETPDRKIVRGNGAALVLAMQSARAGGDPAAAQLVACDCVVLAETKDHAHWELLGKCAEALPDQAGSALQGAYDQVEDEEDSHLYHSKGWCRELWLESLGLPAVLPPPEERENAKSAIAAAKAKKESAKSR